MKLSLLSTLASGVFACAVAIATGLSTHMALTQAEANIAQARTVEVLQATATRIAELKPDHLVISATLIPTSEVEQMTSAGNPMIPLHEAPTEQVEALNVPVTIYPIPATSTLKPPTSGAVSEATARTYIAIHRSQSTGTATVSTDTPSPFPIITETPTPINTPVEDVVIVPIEIAATPTFAPTLTIEPPPTPAPTDVPKSTQAQLTSTVEPSATPEPIVTPTIEPTVTDSPLASPLATPTMEATAAP